MITEKEIANDIDNVLLKAEILANPFYNDAGGSKLWSEIANKLIDIKNILMAFYNQYIVKICVIP